MFATLRLFRDAEDEPEGMGRGVGEELKVRDSFTDQGIEQVEQKEDAVDQEDSGPEKRGP